MSNARILRERAEALMREADALEAEDCTGIAASWCPTCGDCVCPHPEDSKDDPECPLHNRNSIHADNRVVAACGKLFRTYAWEYTCVKRQGHRGECHD